MTFRTLGRTELRVSEIGFGALEIGRNWPNWRKSFADFSRPEDDKAVSVVHEAIDAGVNFFDTAPAYLDSERLLGIALKGKRDRIILGTKCGEWFDGTQSIYDYGYEEVFRFLENSLTNLKTDYVDLLQIHSGKADIIRKGETMAAMKVLRQQGKARFLGISVDSEEAALAAIETNDYDCIQVSYNVLNRVMESRVFPLCIEKRIGVIVKDALATGRLSAKAQDITDSDLRQKVRGIAEKASGRSMELAEYAIRFVLSHPAVSSIIIGTRRPEHFHANLRAMECPEVTAEIGRELRE